MAGRLVEIAFLLPNSTFYILRGEDFTFYKKASLRLGKTIQIEFPLLLSILDKNPTV